MRKIFELTESQFQEFLEATKPLPVMFLSGGIPMGRSRQERANDKWAEFGKLMGFAPMSVRPTGQGDRFFSAEIIGPMPPKEREP